MRIDISDLKRFKDKIELSYVTGCWNWKAYKNEDGYGKFRLNGISMSSHVVYYFIWNGELIEDEEIHHICDNRECVNPFHLESLTKKEHGRTRLKTHCKNGHEFTKENTYYRKDTGNRQCKECGRNNAWMRKNIYPKGKK